LARFYRAADRVPSVEQANGIEVRLGIHAGTYVSERSEDTSHPVAAPNSRSEVIFDGCAIDAISLREGIYGEKGHLWWLAQ
jgi:hypothetical protein